MRSSKKDLFQTTNTVASASLRSEVIDMQSYLGLAVETELAGASIQGSIKLQGSNDGVDWYDMDTQTISTAAKFFVNKADFYFSLASILITSTDADTITVNKSICVMKGH